MYSRNFRYLLRERVDRVQLKSEAELAQMDKKKSHPDFTPFFI